MVQVFNTEQGRTIMRMKYPLSSMLLLLAVVTDSSKTASGQYLDRYLTSSNGSSASLEDVSSVLVSFTKDNLQRLSELCSPEARGLVSFKYAAIQSKNDLNKPLIQCINLASRRVLSTDYLSEQRSVPRLLRTMCGSSLNELSQCYLAHARAPLPSCFSERGRQFEEAVRSIVRITKNTLCSGELDRISEPNQFPVGRCLHSVRNDIKHCFGDFSQYIHIEKGPANNTYNKEMCSNIGKFAKCVQTCIDGCNIVELSVLAGRLTWKIGYQLPCWDIFNKNEDISISQNSRGTNTNNISKEFAKLNFGGDKTVIDHKSFSHYLQHNYEKDYYKILDYCEDLQSKSIYQTQMVEGVSPSHTCLKDLLEKTLTTEEMTSPMNPSTMMEAICKNPLLAVGCLDLAVRPIKGCFSSKNRRILEQSRTALSEFLYIFCMQENSVWIAVDGDLLNHCYASRASYIHSCWNTFRTEVLEEAFCPSFGRLTECIEDAFLKCSKSRGHLPSQFLTLKHALMDRLNCLYPYNVQKIAAPILSGMKTSFRSFSSSSRNISHKNEKRKSKKNCELPKLHPRTHQKTMVKRIRHDFKQARRQLQNIVSSMGTRIEQTGPLFDFLKGNFRQFYKKIYEYCPGQRREDKFFLVEKLANTTLSCIEDRLVSDSQVDRWRTVNPVATMRNLCRGNDSFWSCYADAAKSIGHCYNHVTRRVNKVLEHIRKAVGKSFCSSFNKMAIPSLQVNRCLWSRWLTFRDCALVFFKENLDVLEHRPRDIFPGYLSYTCYKVPELLECLEDGIHSCGIPSLSFKAAQFKWKFHRTLNCSRGANNIISM